MVETARLSRSTALIAWFFVSETYRVPPSSARPCGSLKAARSKGPSARPFSPEPITASTLPDMSATTILLWFESATNSRRSTASASTLPGKERGRSHSLSRSRREGRGLLSMSPAASSSDTISPMIRSKTSKVISPSCLPMTLPSGSMNISVGHARTVYSPQMAKSASFTTGCSIS